MGEIKSVKIAMTVDGDEGMSSSLEFTNTNIKTVLLQQKAMLEAQLSLVNQQLEGKI